MSQGLDGKLMFDRVHSVIIKLLIKVKLITGLILKKNSYASTEQQFIQKCPIYPPVCSLIHGRGPRAYRSECLLLCRF